MHSIDTSLTFGVSLIHHKHVENTSITKIKANNIWSIWISWNVSTRTLTIDHCQSNSTIILLEIQIQLFK